MSLSLKYIELNGLKSSSELFYVKRYRQEELTEKEIIVEQWLKDRIDLLQKEIEDAYKRWVLHLY